MDEIDAALDFKNVSIVANYIKERTRNAQFIIISLRSNMFELAGKQWYPVLRRPSIETHLKCPFFSTDKLRDPFPFPIFQELF